MIQAVSRGSPQLLVSRVVLAQCFSPQVHNKSKETAKRFHTHAYKSSSLPGYISPLLAFSSVTTSHTYLNLYLLGSLAKRSVSTAARKLSMPQRQKLYISSPAQLLSPFIPPSSHPSLFSWSGWSSRLRSLRNFFVSSISTQQIRSRLKTFKEKFSSREFRSVAANLYSEINKAIAAGDAGKLRSLLTETMYTTTAKEVGLKERTVDKMHSFLWDANLELPRVVCVRFTRISVEKLEDFAQVTVYFHGSQTLQVVDVSGKVISSTTTPVSEYWTFERHLQKFNSSWKLCGKPTPDSVDNTL